ncbi:MAG: hypothetical protein O7C75_17690 [Verrucomicrobia bacterium]|nr:hypothetical protein [Verrucomicrobiota bacterium]
MRVIQVLSIFILGLSTLFIITPSAYSQYDGRREGKEDLSSSMETITLQNVRYLLPKGTKFRKRAGVITFEGPGEYTARRLSDLEERLQESENELKRLERVFRSRGTDLP